MASIEANQAAVLSARGERQEAGAIFSSALERIQASAAALEAEEAQGGQGGQGQGQGQGQGGQGGEAEAESNLFMVQALHPLYALTTGH